MKTVLDSGLTYLLWAKISMVFQTENNISVINVRQTGYSFPFSHPSKKEGRMKGERSSQTDF